MSSTTSPSGREVGARIAACSGCTAAERELVAAFLRCAAHSSIHEVITALGPGGRLSQEAWSAFYASGNDAATAAEALAPRVDIEQLRAELETTTNELHLAEVELSELQLLFMETAVLS